MTRALLAAVALALAGCTSTTYTETVAPALGEPRTIVITGGIGGLWNDIIERYNGWITENARVIVDGPVISSDAFAAFSVPGMCYTDRAVWSPHAMSEFGLIPVRSYTEKASAMLPPPLREAFLESGWSYNHVLWPHWGVDWLREHWPEGECDEETMKEIRA